MKVLLVFPQQDGQTGLFTKRAFLKLGCEVKVVDAKREPRKMLPVALEYKPDLIFCSRTELLATQMRTIHDKHPEFKTACWNVDKKLDVKDFGPKLIKLFRSCRILYTVAKGNIAQYQIVCAWTKIIHLQQGCDPQTHKTEELTPEDHEKYDCDVVFAGSIESCGGDSVIHQREPLLKAIEKNFHLRWFGETKESRIFDSEHNKACQCAKIVLGHNGWPTVTVSMSVRDYKVMGAGGFLLTQFCHLIGKWFPIDKEKVCDVYRNREDCLRKIEFYLKHEKLRQEIAQRGQQFVYKKHKYIDRIRKVLKDVEKL